MTPDVLACDMHPDYRSTVLAEDVAGENPQVKLVKVQHNHAHIVSCMEDNLEEPLTCSELAKQVDLSTRQLERLFRKYLEHSPTRYYLGLRLNQARNLLTQTSLPIIEIALASGFVSASHFSKCHREYFGRTPSEERRARR